MSWRLEFAPEVEKDVSEAANWYETRQSGLGVQFVEEVIRVWDALTENPLVSNLRQSRRLEEGGMAQSRVVLRMKLPISAP